MAETMKVNIRVEGDAKAAHWFLKLLKAGMTALYLAASFGPEREYVRGSNRVQIYLDIDVPGEPERTEK